jgi:hypothetical protein
MKKDIYEHGSRIHERTISLRFLGIILGVLRLEVSVMFTLQTCFKPLLLKGGGGGDLIGFFLGVFIILL